MGASAVLTTAPVPALPIYPPGPAHGSTHSRQGNGAARAAPSHGPSGVVVSFYFFAVVLLLRVARGFDFERSPFAISPLGAFGRPACERSFSAIAAISSGA